MRFATLLPVIAAAWTVHAGTVPATSESTCSKPAERKEWRTLSEAQQKSFIKAVKCLGNLPHSSKLAPTGATPDIPPLNTSASFFDDIVYAHVDANIDTHFTALFLPWHRWYLNTFLEALQDQCGYKGVLPYWNWSLDVQNITASPVFNPDPEYGLGTFGTSASNSYAVTDGAFGSVVRAYPTPHVVARQFNLYPFRTQVFPFEFPLADLPATDSLTEAVIEEIVNGSAGNFTDFAYKIDGVRAQGPHNAAHLMMGGDLSNLSVSPNDALFWLHHAHLDCIWQKWQQRSSVNANAYGGGLTQDLSDFDTYPVGAPPLASVSSALPTVGLTGPVTVQEVMSTKSDYLCYQSRSSIVPHLDPDVKDVAWDSVPKDESVDLDMIYSIFNARKRSGEPPEGLAATSTN